jgi:Thioredoxin
MIQKLSRDNYEDFVRKKRAAAVHFDADWDVGHRPTARHRMCDASDVLGEEVNFGEVDWDREVELVKSLRVITVPTVAYYLNGNLVSILPGARQNILGRLERLLQDQQIDRDDGLDHDVAIPRFWSQF